jgi:glycosyltransferase involved in cell wall biosynthesis
MNAPLVSAVIPTRNRPELVVRAVRSVLAQTYANIEVVVVIDGPDAASQSALAAIADPRLHVVALDASVGGGEARNIGVAQSHGEWIGFLDDDDEWLPEKIERQLAAATSSAAQSPLICSQVIARNPNAEFVWPENPPHAPYSEYLLVRNRLGYGEGLMQTSTLLAKRELLERVPFQKGLQKHQDWDWTLRCVEVPGVEVVYVAEPLAIWNLDDGRDRASRADAWKISWNWIKSSRERVTPKAYAAFIATIVAPQAAAQNAWSAFLPTVAELFNPGSPRPRDLMMFAGAWFFPVKLRDSLRRLVHSRTAAQTRDTQNPSVTQPARVDAKAPEALRS